MKLTTLAAAALVLAPLSALSAPVLASDGNWQVGNDQIRIVDRTIDVATPAGRARLLERVEQAAQRVCRDRVGGARYECEADTLRQTAGKPTDWGRAVTLALQERGAPQMASR